MQQCTLETNIKVGTVPLCKPWFIQYINPSLTQMSLTSLYIQLSLSVIPDLPHRHLTLLLILRSSVVLHRWPVLLHNLASQHTQTTQLTDTIITVEVIHSPTVLIHVSHSLTHSSESSATARFCHSPQHWCTGCLLSHSTQCLFSHSAKCCCTGYSLSLTQPSAHSLTQPSTAVQTARSLIASLYRLLTLPLSAHSLTQPSAAVQATCSLSQPSTSV